MDCTGCKSKGCRISQPCHDRSLEYVGEYLKTQNQEIVHAAAELVDGGKVGTLSRLEEIIEYAKARGYEKIGVAYCYGMEQEAKLLGDTLTKAGFRLSMVSCTVDGVAEDRINQKTSEIGVSCNPLGQANQLNHEGVQFSILMGLCLGHDILIQKQLKMDFTTWVVKDRVTTHRPLDALPGYHGKEDLFLENMDRGFHLTKREQFIEKILQDHWQEHLALLDLRGWDAFEKNGVPGSIQCAIEELPQKYQTLFPDREKEIIVYCNGGMQSLYVVMYLNLKGYHHVTSLAGGYSDGSWISPNKKGETQI